MTDTVDPEPPVGRERSALMARIKGKNTRPEMIVRRWLHREGYRFRLHRADLPGRPDITLPRYKTVVFVHGCFWHRHPSCRRSALPSTRRSFWETKLTRNAMRDAEATLQLERMGWRVIVVWECETRRSDVLAERFGDLRIVRAASESP